MIPRNQCGTVRDYSIGEVLYWGVLAIVTIAGILALAFYGWHFEIAQS